VSKSKYIPWVGAAIGFGIWFFTHLPETMQQFLAYVAVGSVIALLIWGYRRFQ
jgi:hypothetical protein